MESKCVKQTQVNKMAQKAALFLASLFISPNLEAALASPVPEVPNLFTLLYKFFNDAPLAAFLHRWENILFSIIISTAISIAFYIGARKKELIPSGFQNFIEWIVEILRDFILEILGPRGKKFIPLLGTLFIFILCMNWIILIPLMKPPTSSFNITVALSLCVFAIVQYQNIKNWGFLGYFYHLAGSPKGFLGWALVPLMFPIELLTQLTRPFTLALRLFGNVVGEDILIGAGALFGVYLLSVVGLPGGLPMQIPFLLLAILTGLMQALVFTLLSTIYILLSMPEFEEKPSDHT